MRPLLLSTLVVLIGSVAANALSIAEECRANLNLCDTLLVAAIHNSWGSIALERNANDNCYQPLLKTSSENVGTAAQLFLQYIERSERLGDATILKGSPSENVVSWLQTECELQR